MRIRVTGGYSDYARGELVELTGASLAAAALKGCLVLRSGALPDANSPAWKTVIVELRSVDREGRAQPADWDRTANPTPTDWVAKVKMLVSLGDYPLGTYRFWVWALDSPTSTPVMADYDDVTLY